MFTKKVFIAVVCIALLDSCANEKKKMASVDASSDTNFATKGVSDSNQDQTDKPSYATNVYWGDTHLHTSNSFDVYLFATPASTPETAYRFARGESVTSPTTGEPMQLQTPLDWLVVSDHAELVGSIPRIFQNDPIVADTETGKIIKKVGKNETEEELLEIYELIGKVGMGFDNKYGVTPEQMLKDLHLGDKRKNTWEDNNATADKFNEPGKFSAFIGWEWSSTPLGSNLHRVVFTPDDSSIANQYLPYSSLESVDPEKLWDWLEVTSQKTGAQFTAIPHNPNVSIGKFFDIVKMDGTPIDKEYSEKRMKWEKTVEVTQIKGDSETHPMLSPNDEFADFETFNFVLTPEGLTPDPTKGDYVRSGLLRGLELESKIGQNPYKVGMQGATDSHTGMSSIEEENFGGKGQHDAEAKLRSHETGIGASKGWDMGAAGLTGVWAKENTRQAIFDAFVRKEVYATTGTRIKVRFFGGFNFNESDLDKDYAAIGYEKGVPMGGDLNRSDKAPSFFVHALKDPNAGNLDRIQIVKGWVNSKGKAKEKVYDIEWSGDRKIGADGKLPSVGNTVDLKTGKYTNSIGAAELKTFWTDPDFDPSQKAFYYVRVLQIPTPRYSLYDALELGMDPKKTNHPFTIQERAYSSPIWYLSN